jgi:hypothetical protein
MSASSLVKKVKTYVTWRTSPVAGFKCVAHPSKEGMVQIMSLMKNKITWRLMAGAKLTSPKLLS